MSDTSERGKCQKRVSKGNHSSQGNRQQTKSSERHKKKNKTKKPFTQKQKLGAESHENSDCYRRIVPGWEENSCNRSHGYIRVWMKYGLWQEERTPERIARTTNNPGQHLRWRPAENTIYLKKYNQNCNTGEGGRTHAGERSGIWKDRRVSKHRAEGAASYGPDLNCTALTKMIWICLPYLSKGSRI